MAIYKLTGNNERLERLEATAFGQEKILERQDLQRILRDQPEALEEGLFIIAEEFGNWEGADRRIDLLGLDVTGRLVVIELKRGETGELMDLQAIRYAAMASTITLQQAIDAHQAYLNNRGIEGDAEELVKEHLENPESQGFQSERPRILLVSEGFSPELTTCALWLNGSGLDVTCIRMQPYQNNGQLLVETSQIVPLPEAKHYLVQVREREGEVQKPHPRQPWYIPGGKAFKERIESAPEGFRADLQRLYAWAVDLEHAGLAKLDTHLGKRATLRPVVSSHNSGLITIWNGSNGASIQFWPSVFHKFAPNAMPLVQKLIAPTPLAFASSVSDVSDKLLSTLRDAYREANGLVMDDGNKVGDGQ